MLVSKSDEGPICPSCNYRVIKLSPNGKCSKCNRKIKNGQEIKKWEGNRE